MWNAIVAAFRAPDTQWMAVGCLTVYLFATAYLARRQSVKVSGSGRETLRLICLFAFVATALAWYGMDYPGQGVPVLIGGMMLGQGAAFWQAQRQRKGDGCGIAPQVVGALVLLLTIAVVWQPEKPRRPRYWDEVRWTGIWGNPNIFGVLMGVGVVLAVGQAVSCFKCQVSRSRRSEIGNWKSAMVRWLRLALFVGATGVLGLGLVKSYSRGAWVGTALGIGYLLWNLMPKRASLAPPLSARPPRGGGAVLCSVLSASDSSAPSVSGESTFVPGQSSAEVPQFRIRWLAPFVGIVVSIVVLLFWNLRHTEQPVVRRAFSVANLDDFSWRNRVTTWEGALQMMAERP